MGAVVLDTSAVLALFDPNDSLHEAAVAAARQIRDAGDRFILPASVLAEVLVGAARVGEEERATIRRLLVEAFGAPRPLDDRIAVATARRRARHGSLPLPDAIVLATADVTEATGVLTGDSRLRELDERILLVQGS